MALDSTSGEFIRGEEIACGANGTVYEATLRGLPVAAKEPIIFSHGKRYGINSLGSVLLPLWEILRELAVLQIFQHKNIVKLCGIVTMDYFGIKVPKYILLDLIEGGTLEPRLKDREQMVLRNILKIIRQIGEALSYLYT